MIKPLVPIIENKNMPHSIEKRQTKRVRNNKRKIKLDVSKLYIKIKT